MTGQEDCMNNEDKVQHTVQKEKILVPVRCCKRPDEEELSVDNDRYRPFVMPRRWQIY